MEWQNPAVASAVSETGTETLERTWPNFDHDIGLTEARELIGRWKRANPDKAHAGAMSKAALNRVLDQDGCVGARMYYGLNPDGTMCMIIVGVDLDGNDMDEGELAERIVPCPPFCAMESALDS